MPSLCFHQGMYDGRIEEILKVLLPLPNNVLSRGAVFSQLSLSYLFSYPFISTDSSLPPLIPPSPKCLLSTRSCRINRILESPRGNMLLVGVGGSGKQSLTRLAAFISNLEVFQITLRKSYSLTDLKTDLASLYIKAGVKNVGTVFLMTDGQVADEKFLVLVNDLLASGEIPDLFPDDEVENIIGSVRPEVHSSGLMDTRENCWRFFIDRVRRQLKVKQLDRTKARLFFCYCEFLK
ncbi:hypothetical protein CHARACLAT_026299 [Characodon lateralis]|uniref:Dynein heavy chain AAA module D4 domain-containing protein n=1 Tax=Characodon lateralis TaxID=208331 RepID=A0ABU7CUH9_9TELE|nr:hypothetical protein [Characodon lateralis]